MLFDYIDNGSVSAIACWMGREGYNAIAIIIYY